MVTIAECLENDEIMTGAKRMGFMYGQGTVLGEPVAVMPETVDAKAPALALGKRRNAASGSKTG